MTAFVPTIAPDAGEGLPTEVVGEYRASTTMTGRLRAMALARATPGSMRRRFVGLDVVHYPLTVPVPPAPTRVAITLHDVQHLDLPRLFPRSERAFRRLAYDRAARKADAVIVPTGFVRDRVLDRLGIDGARVHVVPHGIDHDAFSPGTGRARAVPPLPREAVAAQEPRRAARSLRAHAAATGRSFASC